MLLGSLSIVPLGTAAVHSHMLGFVLVVVRQFCSDVLCMFWM
jgi:hypothetical protein